MIINIIFIAPFIRNMQLKLPHKQNENTTEKHTEVHKVIIRVKKGG